MESEAGKSSKTIVSAQTEVERKSIESKRRKRRKIIAIQEFDHLNRSSLFLVQQENSTEKSKTKKQKTFDFLPKLMKDDSKENSPLNGTTRNKSSQEHKLKSSNDLVPLHKQLMKSKIETFSDNILSPEDNDIEFKPRLKSKHNNAHTTLSDKLQGIATTCQKLEYSLHLNQNLNKNSFTLEKQVPKEKPLLKSINKKNSKNSNGKLNEDRISKSFKMLTNIIPDTSGNNQGLFDVTYPINDSSLLSLSSLDMNLESVLDNKARKTNAINQMIEKTVTPNFNPRMVNIHRSTSELKNTKQVILQNGQNLRNVSRGTIINLVTPSPKERTAFDHNDSLHTPTPSKLTPIHTKRHKNQSTARVSLIRSGTFIKESAAEYSKDSPKRGFNEKSALNGASPNIRKRWSKSLGVSLLDNSGKVHLILAPSLNNSLVDSPSTVFPLKSSQHKKIENIGSIKCFASTPLGNIKKQNGLLNGSAKKQNSDFRSIKKTKMPNFAQIHQKAYEKLENIKEMSERKAARAQKLLSGHKPEIGMKNKSPCKSRKALNYSPGKHMLKIAARIPVVQPVLPGNTNSINTLNKKTFKKRSLEKKCILRPGFIVDKSDKMKKTMLKQEQLKNLANKKPTVTDSVESRRKVVQNVRTNRRFELLMQMRKK